MDHDKLFTQTPLLKMLIIIVIPGAISMLTSALFDVIDGVLVGNVLGETAFAAINLAMPYVIILFAVGDMIGVGSAIPISIKLGEKDSEAANSIFSYSVALLFSSGLLVGLVMFFITPTLIALQGATGKLAETAIVYLRVYACFIPISSMNFALDNYLKVCGKVKRSMVLNIFMAGAGAVLEAFLLIFLKADVWAAAFAYSFAMVVVAIIGFWPFFQGKMLLKFSRPRPTVALTKQIVMAGMPAFLNNIASRVVAILLNARMLTIGGTQAVSIYGIMVFADTFIMSVLYGIVDSLQPSLGYNWGSKNYKRVFAIGKSLYVLTAVFALLYIAFIGFGYELIVRIFMFNAASEFIVAAQGAFYIMALQWLVRWFVMSTNSFLLACGQSRHAVGLSVAATLVLPLAAIVLLMPFDLLGVWLNPVVSSFVSAGIAAWLLSDFLRKMKSRREQAHGQTKVHKASAVTAVSTTAPDEIAHEVSAKEADMPASQN